MRYICITLSPVHDGVSPRLGLEIKTSFEKRNSNVLTNGRVNKFNVMLQELVQLQLRMLIAHEERGVIVKNDFLESF